MSNRYPMPDKPTTEYLGLCAKSANLEDRELYRRASQVWGNALAMSGLTERERDLCATNAYMLSSRARYTGKSED